MAERILSFEGGRIVPRLYSWDLWFQPDTIWKLVQGADFQSKLHTMENLIRRTATKRRKKVRLVVDQKHKCIIVINNPETNPTAKLYPSRKYPSPKAGSDAS